MWDHMCHVWLDSDAVGSVYACEWFHGSVRQLICIMREPQAAQAKDKILNEAVQGT